MPSMKRKNHNWNQIHRIVITKLGFRQVSSYQNQFLYYQRDGSPIIPVQKSNNLSIEYVRKVIPLFSISYEDFVKLLKE